MKVWSVTNLWALTDSVETTKSSPGGSQTPFVKISQLFVNSYKLGFCWPFPRYSLSFCTTTKSSKAIRVAFFSGISTGVRIVAASTQLYVDWIPVHFPCWMVDWNSRGKCGGWLIAYWPRIQASQYRFRVLSDSIGPSRYLLIDTSRASKYLKSSLQVAEDGYKRGLVI